MGLVATPFGGRNELPRPPAEIAEEVELFARRSGRHATLHFIPLDLTRPSRGGTWVVDFELRSADKRLLLYQESRAESVPTERVWLHVPDSESRTGYRPLNIHELGAGGVKQFLERGDTWSGRGEFLSIEEQARKAMEANRQVARNVKQEQREASRNMAEDTRRRRLKIPFLPIEIDLSNTKG